jgi:putative DNA primase/helicase
MQGFMSAIAAETDPIKLEEDVAKAIARSNMSEVEREQLGAAIQTRSRELGVRLAIGTVRRWVRRVNTVAVTGFVEFDDEGHPLPTLANLRALLSQLGYVIRYNVIKKAIEVLIPDSKASRDNRDNVAIAQITSECESARMSPRHAKQFMISLADENLFNPVATWIESVPWDGVSRLDAFYDTVKLAPGSSELMKKKLMRKWLVQAVGAAFSYDGIANQGVLTFVGPQNVGKTTWFQRLAPVELDAILTGHTLDMRSKDSIFIALSYWIVELGELDATFSKSEISALKSFITQNMDKLRRPYAATESAFGRRTVFGATVNDDQYLNDPTGNRRYWSIPVVGFDLDHKIDMQQMWAEVLVLYQEGERWSLSMEEAAELNTHNEDFTVMDPIEERIAAGFPWGKDDWEWITSTEVLTKIGTREPNKLQTIAASKALKKLNGGQRRKSNGKVLFAVPKGGSEFLG